MSTPRSVSASPWTNQTFSGDFLVPRSSAGDRRNSKLPDGLSPITPTSGGNVKDVTFPSDGVFPYYCDSHGVNSDMFGAVPVVPGAARRRHHRAPAPSRASRCSAPRCEMRRTPSSILALDDAMRAAAADDAVRVVILAGAGPSFSAGHDLKGRRQARDVRKLRRTPEGRFKHERELYVEKCLAIYHLPKPTIAQVQGHCVAAGLMLAAMCDLIVAADDAVFANPVLRMTGAGVELLVEPWELGLRKAKEFLWTGDALDAR
jgi:hypothetical protein